MASRRSFVRRRIVEIVAALAAVGVIGAGATQIWVAYEDYVVLSEADAVYEASVLSERAAGRLVAVSHSLESLIESHAFARGGGEAGSLASREFTRVPEVKQFIAYDGEGRVAWAFAPARDRDFVSPIRPEFVLDHMAAPSITTEVGVPIDIGGGRRLLPVSRALLDQEGRLRGVIAALIDGELVESVLQPIRITESHGPRLPDGALVLTRSGTVLAAHPPLTVAVGTSVAGAPPFRLHVGSQREGVYRSRMDRDGNVRLVAHRLVSPGQLIVTASIVRNPLREALLPAARSWGVLALLTGLLCIVIGFAFRHRSRPPRSRRAIVEAAAAE